MVHQEHMILSINVTYVNNLFPCFFMFIKFSVDHLRDVKDSVDTFLVDRPL
jgi:hypothetical protein